MYERSAKLPKIEHQRGDDGYLPGNITEIEIHNFMTYDHLKCQPAPRLNLVIGPNGSGKSSLVCAIALGLAGEPQLLGRASSIGAFVKRGEDSGFIKITLRGNTTEEQISVTRKINTHNRSEWLVNGKVVAKRDVTEVIQRFNIQVNNLTQFLPQDRVCEFAKLSPIQLLEETEKAVGNPELAIQHSALVEKSRELKRLEVVVKQNEDTLNQLKELNAEQENDVERVRQREKLLAKVESMKKKLPWLKYDMKKLEYMQAKTREDDAKNILDEAAKNLNNLSMPIEEKKKRKGKLEMACKKVNNIIAQNCNKRGELVESENHLVVKVHAKYDEMEDLRRQEESRQQRILKAKEELRIAESELQNLPLSKPSNDALEKLNNQIMELEEFAIEKRAQKTEKENILSQKKVALRQCLDRLKSMENANMKLLQALRNSGSEKIVEAYEWLQRHRNELRKEVYGPVLLEVKVPDRVHASYLEQQVPYYIWKSFITLDPADRDYLVKGLKSLDVPVLNYVPDGSHNNTTFAVSEKMHDLGVYSRLDQVFDAPAAVKEVLTSQAGLDRSYVGHAYTDQRADEVPQLEIFDLWTPDNHYRWSTSRYSSHISASVESVHASRLFLSSVDVEEVERLRSRSKALEETTNILEDGFKKLQVELRHLEDEAAKLHRQREVIVNAIKLEKSKRRDVEFRICQRKMKLDSIENEGDLETSMLKLTAQVATLNMQRFQNADKMKSLLTEVFAFKWSFAEQHLTSIELDMKIREMELNLKQHEKTALQASARFEQCKKETEICRKELAAAKSQAESIAMITPELERKFVKMPRTIEDLEAAILDNISQANSILFLNDNILEEYEARQRKIDQISNKLEVDRKELDRCLSEIGTLKGKWLPALRNLVAKINETFSHNFQEMAVAGEVSLDEHDKDFDKFGILIKVKFRQTGQLQVLSAHHQSGGERSVSTILYLVSLQDLTNCPFRVVDEINQGMDPINERKMFQQLVRAASQPNTPQCFLLTPKLLPDLEYSDACSILNIMNGPWIEKPSKVWSGGESWRMVVGLAGEG